MSKPGAAVVIAPQAVVLAFLPISCLPQLAYAQGLQVLPDGRRDGYDSAIHISFCHDAHHQIWLYACLHSSSSSFSKTVSCVLMRAPLE